MGEYDEQLVFEMGYNKGFKDGIKGSIPKDQYEARLKADMVAMLTEILLEAEENTVRWYVGRVDGKSDDVVLMETLQEIIQQKIDKLKESK